MKDADFLDPDWWKGSSAKPVDPIVELNAKKQDALVARIEEIDGRVYKDEEMLKHIRIEMRPGVDNKQLIYWRGRPVLFFEWDGVGNLKVTKV